MCRLAALETQLKRATGLSRHCRRLARLAIACGFVDGGHPASLELRSSIVSYTLLIIVAILAARPGDLLLLEAPEAHLHPRGQAKIGELMALAAKGGGSDNRRNS